ncbi:hypothetical protein AKJ16_DCAP06109 [Drosera capensis]
MNRPPWTGKLNQKNLVWAYTYEDESILSPFSGIAEVSSYSADRKPENCC